MYNSLLFQNFLQEHMLLIYRSIGMNSHSLKGRSVEALNSRLKTRFFPELWAIRATMTDQWKQTYGSERECIHKKQDKKATTSNPITQCSIKNVAPKKHHKNAVVTIGLS